MPKILAALVILLLMGLVITRVLVMKRKGVESLHFGKIDKTDFLIPPFALFYFYMIFGAALNWPPTIQPEFFHFPAISWLGILMCLAGLILLGFSLVSFGTSFRIGIDFENPDQLVTSGVFAISRNPIYVAFWGILLGQFLVHPNWIFLVYLATASWLFHRQVLREEQYLKGHYGEEFLTYCSRVRRYL
ncbi:MAG: isoprenylcysteine carboxylmethyltransferase family protein [Anaerolineales bacterium]|nr:isoprenylcysteine carboxylmethyltransferase family protein [Anaerolineales bacterium]